MDRPQVGKTALDTDELIESLVARHRAVDVAWIVAKYVFMLTSLVIAGHLFVQMARPGRLLADQAIVYALPIGIILFAIIVQLALMGSPTRSIMLGDAGNWLACIIIVPILAIVPFAGLMLILRRCAPTDLRGAGFAAGVFAATIGANIYAAHCPCDMPTFVGVWYPLAFIFGGIVGSFFAPRLARW
jgi:hypothetical protein